MGNAMHGMETRMLLRHGLEAGESKTELARRFGVSRRTIHHWIETDRLDRDVEAGAARYAERARVAHKLDPYKGIIDERLSAYPKLSAGFRGRCCSTRCGRWWRRTAAATAVRWW